MTDKEVDYIKNAYGVCTSAYEAISWLQLVVCSKDLKIKKMKKQFKQMQKNVNSSIKTIELMKNCSNCKYMCELGEKYKPNSKYGCVGFNLWEIKQEKMFKRSLNDNR